MSKKADPIADLRPYVGREIGVSPWLTIDQDMVDTFGPLTRDVDPIHNDPEWAKTGPYGGTIAQGFFVLSLLGGLMKDVGLPGSTTDDFLALNYGLDKVRFIAPVPVGARIRNRAGLDEIREKGDGSYIIKTTNTVEVDGLDRPGLVAEQLTILVPR